MTNDWTQPLCEPCFAAWTIGRGERPREPTRVAGDAEPDPCMVCGEPTRIYVRVDPALTESLAHARERTP